MSFKIFGDILCGKTLAQMHESMAQPFAIEGALMPDAHAGYSLPIGGVVRTAGCVVPAWVGYDIGCGMRGVRTSLHKDFLTKERLEAIKELVIQSVPMGNKKHPATNMNGLRVTQIRGMFTGIGKEIFDTRGQGQLGTLGGGNHFIEIGYDEEDMVWICVHSGSRGVGHALATYYMNRAAQESGVQTRNVEGAFPLYENTELFRDYMKDFYAALEWSCFNRALMTKAVTESMREVVPKEFRITRIVDNIHNTVVSDTKGNYIHRKGATSAEKGESGIIPGNMRDGFFVVKGKGNLESLCSASHGAGRVMSRGEAKKEVNLEEFLKEMESVVTNISEHTIDEAPAAYKDIFEVMDSQKDCVDIVHHVKPLLNLKG